MSSSEIWVEKYRPSSVSELLLPIKIKKQLKAIVSSGDCPNLLLYSQSPGTGKTSTAKAIVADLKADYLYINVSDERSIDTLRTKIAGFAPLKAMNDVTKIVIMDEFDGATPALQDALRAAIEEYHEYCRFILTCNNIHKIKDPIVSRCQVIEYTMSNQTIKDELIPKMEKRLYAILEAEGFTSSESAIHSLVEKVYPDQRKMLQILQQYTAVQSHVSDDIVNSTTIDSQLFEMILSKKFLECKKIIVENGYDAKDVLSSLYRDFVPMMKNESKAQAIIKIAEYSYRCEFSTDKEIQLSACILELMVLC